MIELKTILEKVINVDTTFVKNILLKVKNKIVGKELGNFEIEEILNNAFKQYNISFVNTFNISILPEDNANVGISKAAISENLNIEVYYLDYFYEIFKDDYLYDTFIKVVRSLLSHELIHRAQFKKILYKVKGSNLYYDIIHKLESDPNKISKYLCDKQELMAFARQAVEEFRLIEYDDETILKLIRRPYSNELGIDRAESNTFWFYTEWFELYSQELKRFLNYMYAYLVKDK